MHAHPRSKYDRYKGIAKQTKTEKKVEEEHLQPLHNKTETKKKGSIIKLAAWIMEARKQQTPKNQSSQRLKTWEPQSRIAPYIKGNAKLEDIVSRDKLVRPEHRHNRRAFLALVNDDDELNYAKSAYSSKTKSCNTHLSAISRCLSSSTKTSATSLSLSQGGGGHPRHLTKDDLTSTIVEKNEHITALREQLDTLRSCARVEQLDTLRSCAQVDPISERDAELDSTASAHQSHQSLRVVLERMLECLLDMLTNLKHQDEHDEHMAEFVAAAECARENVLRRVDALRQSNAHKDEELRQMSGEQATLRDDLHRLKEKLKRAEENTLSEVLCSSGRNDKLMLRLHQYELQYESAAKELHHLSELSNCALARTTAEKEDFDKKAAEFEKLKEEQYKSLEDWQLRCQHLSEEKQEAEKIMKHHENEMEQLCRAKEENITKLESDIKKLEDEIDRLKSAEQKLHAENIKLREQLGEKKEANQKINDEIEQLKKEKEFLEKALNEGKNDTYELTEENAQKSKVTSFMSQETRWREIKECFHKTALRTGLLPVSNEDVR